MPVKEMYFSINVIIFSLGMTWLLGGGCSYSYHFIFFDNACLSYLYSNSGGNGLPIKKAVALMHERASKGYTYARLSKGTFSPEASRFQTLKDFLFVKL